MIDAAVARPTKHDASEIPPFAVPWIAGLAAVAGAVLTFSACRYDYFGD